MTDRRYETLGPLLSGTGSRAYLALDLSQTPANAPRPVVLVWLPEEIAAKPELVAEVEKETARAALLDHPHIVRVIGLTRQDSGTGRVVEYVDGESLRRVLELVQTLPAPVAARVVADAAMGAHYAHLAGNDDGTPLVHGDLRPETLLLSFRGITKVSGYGALAVAPKKPGDRRVRGRRSHCAPEQVVGGRGTASVQTDVYLLGAILFECLTGEAPFAHEPDFDHAVVTLPLPELPEEICPRPLAQVLGRAMAKKASDRYPSALAFRDALEEAMESLPSHEALGKYLKGIFPEDDPARVSRRLMLEKRIAMGEVSPPLVPAPAAPKQISKVSTAVKVLGVVLVAGGAFWVVKQGRDKAHPVVAAPMALPAQPLTAPPPAEEPKTEAFAPLPLQAPEHSDDKNASEKPEHAPSPAPEPTTLSVYVEPPVDVAVDGEPRGRSPITVPVLPGSHVLHLTDRRHGIDTKKTVAVGSHPKSERFYLSQGYVNVAAPPGAEIFIDGKLRGKAPQRELGVYEGNHKLRVSLSGSHWQESFNARPNERMSFTVNFD